MDKEQQKTNNNQDDASGALKWLQENQKKNNYSEPIIPKQIHHPVPSSSSTPPQAQFTRPIFRGRGRRAAGGRIGGSIKGGAKSLGKKVVKQGAKKVATAILSNPYVLAAIGIGIAILLLIIIIAVNICQLTSAVDFIRPDWLRAMCIESDIAEEIPPPPKGVTITKTGPDSIPNDGIINYRITVDYDSSLADIPANQMILVDQPDYVFDPASTTHIPPATTDGNLYKWNLTDLASVTVGTVTSYTASINIKPTVTNSYVINNAYIIVSDVTVQPPPKYPLPTCDSGDYLACLKNQFNVTLRGAGSASRARFFYNTLRIPFKYPYYLELFKRVGVTITITSSYISAGGGHLVTDFNGDITIYQAYFSDRQSTREQYLIHETAHTVSRTSAGGRFQDQLWNLVNSKGFDITCFRAGSSGPLVKTYPINDPRSYKNEAWAEAVADSVVCQDTGTCGPWGGGTITNFPRTCGGMYRFVDSNLLK